jgi:hypothetical protein
MPKNGTKFKVKLADDENLSNKKPARASSVSAFRVSLSRCALCLVGLNHAFLLVAFFKDDPFIHAI